MNSIISFSKCAYLTSETLKCLWRQNSKFLKCFSTYQNSQFLSANKIIEIKSQLKNGALSFKEWNNIRDDLMKNYNQINKINVDATILGICESDSNLIGAQSYIQFLKEKNIEPNNASIGRLMKIYYASSKDKKLNNDEIKQIDNFYNYLLKKHSILDSITCENLILGISLTNHYWKLLKLLDMIKLTNTPSINAYSAVIANIFKNKTDTNIGWSLLNEMIKNDRQPKCNVFIEYFKSITNEINFVENLEKMLIFIENHNIIITREVIQILSNILRNLNIKNSEIYISQTGNCSHCGFNLQNVSITENEFNLLKNEFLNKVLIRKDIFQKSSPEEVQLFIKFIAETVPYDFVIDGLNVSLGSGNRSPINMANRLAAVVKHLAHHKNKILVLGRKHMNLWPKQQINFIKRHAKIFFTNDLSHDDPFILYATLKSGPNTNFISRDLMRSHAFLLGNELKPIFRLWQQGHQFSLQTITESGKVILKNPHKFKNCAHKVKSSWHIPFQEEYCSKQPTSFESLHKWLCISCNQFHFNA